MRAVNLLPRDEVRTRRGLPGPWVILAAAAPILAGSLVYLGYSTEHSSLAEKRAELSAVEAKIKALSASGSGAAGQAALVGERSQRTAALVDALSKATAWDVTLDDLARVLPTDVWLTTLTAQSPTPAGSPAIPTVTPAATTTTTTTTTTTPAATPPPAPNPTSFTLTGYAQSQDAVAHLLARLQLLPMLSNVTLVSTNSSVVSTSPNVSTGKQVLQFQLTAAMQPMPKGSTP